MTGIIHGSLTASSTESNARTAVRFVTVPTPIKYLLLEVPFENKGDVYLGGSTVSSDNAPAIAKGSTKEFTFRHHVKESPGDLSDFYVNFGHNKDVIKYLAITI